MRDNIVDIQRRYGMLLALGGTACPYSWSDYMTEGIKEKLELLGVMRFTNVKMLPYRFEEIAGDWVREQLLRETWDYFRQNERVPLAKLRVEEIIERPGADCPPMHFLRVSGLTMPLRDAPAA